MTSHRILQVNAAATAASAVVMLALRGSLPPLFGLDGPLVLDAIAVALLAYAGALVFAARRRPVTRETLLAFTVADGMWVAASAAILFFFWAQLSPLARVLVIVCALAVDVFAMLQFRAARTIASRRPARI
jgi:hypothetical protein